jgi:hypothetical protein
MAQCERREERIWRRERVLPVLRFLAALAGARRIIGFN